MNEFWKSKLTNEKHIECFAFRNFTVQQIETTIGIYEYIDFMK